MDFCLCHALCVHAQRMCAICTRKKDNPLLTGFIKQFDIKASNSYVGHTFYITTRPGKRSMEEGDEVFRFKVTRGKTLYVIPPSDKVDHKVFEEIKVRLLARVRFAQSKVRDSNILTATFQMHLSRFAGCTLRSQSIYRHGILCQDTVGPCVAQALATLTSIGLKWTRDWRRLPRAHGHPLAEQGGPRAASHLHVARW